MKVDSGVEHAIDDVKKVSVIKMPKQRAIKLLEYLDKIGNPQYFKGIEVSINEYGDISLNWERRQFEIEIILTGSGPLTVYRDVLGKIDVLEVSTVRNGAGLFHNVWKEYTINQRTYRKNNG